jgi:hypothetical protein
MLDYYSKFAGCIHLLAVKGVSLKQLLSFVSDLAGRKEGRT